MKFTTLDAWLAWQETLNPAEIDLGLDRVAQVLRGMGHADHFDCPLIMVAGTNGKGSVVALLESIALAAGYRVCSYTSPHILAYNERIKTNGVAVDDASLCQAFERVEQGRADIALTYFEFGTLAAIDLFMRQKPELVIMEVGLGGRLDAVNIMQPDVSVITSIAIDHVDWLGDNREDIAREKAGILRTRRPAVCGDGRPPASLLQQAEQLSVPMQCLYRDFRVEHDGELWNLRNAGGDITGLPRPALFGEFQLDNAATAIVALRALESRLPLDVKQISEGLVAARLAGRYEILRKQPLVIADVAHNPHAVASLVAQLESTPVAGDTRIVIAMLADKPVAEVVKLLIPVADGWYSAGLEGQSRGLSADAMSNAVASVLREMAPVDAAGIGVKLCAVSTVEQAIDKALGDSTNDDRIIILGSFFTVAAAMHYFA